ncbi:MAG: ABC transporter substrate-binding protein [Burkholderiales bacterium]|nr:ABC transporter substrate-binding protein [Burkholderiales bacterium]
MLHSKSCQPLSEPPTAGPVGAGHGRRALLGLAAGLVGSVFGAAFAQAARRTVRIAAPGPRSTVSLPAELAAAAGLDAPHGLRLQVVPVNGGAVALQHLVERNVDFAIAGMPAGMLMRANRSPIVAIAALEERPHYVLVVRRDLAASVRSVAALRGRTVGVHSGSLAAKTTSHLLSELVLRSAGVMPDEVRFVAVGQNWDTQASAFQAGTVDAIMGDEAFSARLIDELGAVALLNLGDPVQAAGVAGAGFLRGTLFTREELVPQDPKLVEAVVRTFQSTLAWVRANAPERVAELIGTAVGGERQHLARLLRDNPRMYSPDARFSARQLRDTEVFFRASLPGHAAAQALTLDTMVVDRWAGRRD